MADNGMLKSLDYLTCPLCCKLFNNPKYLPCHHFFCEECLENEQKQSSEFFCIKCEQQAVIPPEGVKELDNAFFISHLVNEFIDEHKGKGDKDVTRCNGCSDSDLAEAFCSYCSLNMCSTCLTRHRSNPKTVSHSIIPLLTLRGVLTHAKPETMLCEAHDIELLHYCESCDQLICVLCTESDHAEHDHNTVKKKADQYRQELTKMATAVDKISESLSAACNTDKVEEMLKKQNREVYRNIDQYYDKLIQQLLEQKEQLKQQVDDTSSQTDKVVKEMLHTQKEAVSIKALYSSVGKGYDEELLSMKKHVLYETERLKDRHKKVVHSMESATIDFVPVKIKFPQFGHFIVGSNVCNIKITDLPPYAVAREEVEFTIITNDVDGCRCSKGGRHIQLLQYTTGAFINAVIRDNNDGSYLVSFLPLSHGDVKFFVLVDGQQTARAWYSIAVRGYSSITKPSLIVEGDDDNFVMESPWGIAWSRKGTWAVADYTQDCVYLFDSDNHLIKTLSSGGDDGGQLQAPQGVAFDEDNNLYVTDGGNFRVMKFDGDGNYLLQFGSQGSDPGQFDSTWGIVVHNGKVYVADEQRQCVSVFTISGQFCSTIGLGTLDAPHDVTVNRDEHLLVADFNQSCIHKFALDGKYISKFGTKISEHGQPYGPYSVAADIYGFILVTDTYNHRISIFDKDGSFVHCFGSCGWGLHANFHFPNGIALSPNGSIYVSDYESKRVQVFSL